MGWPGAGRPRDPRGRGRDRGAVDISVEMLFAMVALMGAVLVLVECVAYWHVRNVFEDAASEGARVAAALDGSCADGIAVASASIETHAGGWSGAPTISCTDGPVMVVTITGRTPDVIGVSGFTATVSESAPKER